MTQFNLLPDIKLQYLKAERNRRLVISISVIVTLASMFIAGAMFSLTAIQRTQLNNLSSDIKKQGSNLSGQTNLNDILTIQNQIETLNTLHQQEPEATNLATYLYQIVPTTASLSDLSIDFNADTISLDGVTNSLTTVDQMIDSMKFATYTVNGSSQSKSAFSNVVLSAFSVNQGVSFTITLNFDPTLFNNTEKITLTVPSKVTTRSELDQPTILFNKPQTTNGG